MTQNGSGPTGTQYDVPPGYGWQQPPAPAYATMPPLRRSRTDRVFAGICGGVARSMNIDPTLVRVVAVLAAFLTGGAAILAYIVGIFVIPEDGSDTYPPAPGYAPAAPYYAAPPTPTSQPTAAPQPGTATQPNGTQQ